ncbi:AEC family transporter [Albirhodobacter sp. R86504]|jgi:predicted permease|uniref:AEC family transporter n=1 Tax=Albirhodobacter sp. R86504 TaxID=3093848 RepID=UPI003670EF51
MLMQTINILGPIAIITLIGYLLGRSKVGIETRSLSTLVITVATPALIFNTLTSLHVEGDVIRTMASAAVLCVVIAGVIGAAGLVLVGGSVRSFLPTLMLPNSGNMGLPLVTLAFGPQGLQFGVAYFFAVALIQNSVGMSIYAGSVKLTEILRQPLIYAVIAVLGVTWTGVQVPEIVQVTTKMLSGMMIPSMLILLGASLAKLQIADLRPALMIAGGRLALGLLSAVIVIWGLGLEGVAAGTAFLLATMPTAIVSYVFAERFGHKPQQVAGAVVASTLLTFAVLPVLIWAALAISTGEWSSSVAMLRSGGMVATR